MYLYITMYNVYLYSTMYYVYLYSTMYYDLCVVDTCMDDP